MVKPYVSVYINNLQRQIADAATKLARKKSVSRDHFRTSCEESRQYIWSKVDAQKYQLIGSDAAYALVGQREEAASEYASESYVAASKVSAKSTIVEGVVFKNNQEFDFKV